MKYLKKYNEGWFSKSKSNLDLDKSNPNYTSEFLKYSNTIKSNFNEENLTRYDSGFYGYYFRYKLDSDTSLEVGLNSASISKNGGKFENVNVDRSTIHDIVNFFESKSKVGGIIPDISSSPGW